MATLRIYLLLIGLSLFLSANIIAQKSSLAITGTVVEVKPAGPMVLKNGKYERQETYFQVQIRLQYHNVGEVPLIVPTTYFFYGKKKLLFLDIPSFDSKVSATVDEWMFPESTDWAPSLLTELGRIEPSRYFVIIEPGGYYETGDTIRAKSGYKLDIRPSQDKRQRDLEFATPEYSSFKVRYSLSLKNSSESTEPLADAQRRWSRFGKLVLNSDGDFFFETDVIINKLPDQLAQTGIVKPETISTESIYKGTIFDIRLDEIREGNVEYKREIVVHKGSAVIVPVFDDETVALVRQYRHAAGKFLLEIPAGSLDGDESPETGAVRELEEEIGVTAAKIEKIAEFYVSPGFLTEKMFVFLATEITETSQKLEADELIEIERLTFPQAFDLIRSGGIEDAKTIVGLMMAGAKFNFTYEQKEILSPTATNIKAQGAVSEANGTLGYFRGQFRPCQGTNNHVDICLSLSATDLTLPLTQDSGFAFTLGFNVGRRWRQTTNTNSDLT